MFEFLVLAAELLRQGCNRAYGYLKANFTRLGIPDPATDLRVPKEEFDEALTTAQDPNHTAADIREKNRTQELVIKAFRKYANENLVHNPRLTSVDILELQLHESKPASPIHPPDYPPIVIVDTSKSRQATIKYYVLPGPHQRMGKPKNVKACIVRWVKGRTKPTHISEFVNEAVGTNGPIVIHFDEDERGDTIWFIAVWQIEREHLESPASDPAMFIVS
jgi:hypothetical protein